jgi:hypothetical protein
MQDVAMEQPESALAEASGLMLAFADRTGLDSGRPPVRYLWTDAFAVCNFLELSRATRDGRYLDLALRLVDQVHGVLGRHRADDGRHGWLSGLEGEAARAHPTARGLRIGKALPERGEDEPLDEHLEWERDGQYFHYLTRWMHALDQLARATRQPRFNVWARELAATAQRAFTTGVPGTPGRRMFWKMSVDLSRPTVPSMGQHDPLDGLVTCVQLATTAQALGETAEPGVQASAASGPDLGAAIDELRDMTARLDLSTLDPLGLGGLLVDAARIAQLMRRGAFPDGELLHRVVEAALEGLRHYARSGDSLEPASHRLAFRELGLVTGLSAASLAARSARGHVRPSTLHRLDDILRYEELGASMLDFWRAPARRTTQAWLAHQDINEVMLATCLAPGGYTGIS